MGKGKGAGKSLGSKSHNDARPSGKGWKGGKSPEVREAERRAKAQAKSRRKGE